MNDEAKALRNAYHKAWRDKNKEYMKEQREKNKEYLKEWKSNNKDKLKKHQEDYWLRKAKLIIGMEEN